MEQTDRERDGGCTMYSKEEGWADGRKAAKRMNSVHCNIAYVGLRYINQCRWWPVFEARGKL